MHLPAWGALRALETAAPHAESSAQMAVRAAVAAAQAAVRAAVHIHAVQDAQHQQKLKRRNVKGLAHLVAELSARQAVRIQRKGIAEAHAELHAQPAAKLDAVEIATGNAIEHVRMNVRGARQRVQMTVRVAAKRIASRPARQIVRRLAQTAQTHAEAIALQHVQMTVRAAAKMDVLDAGTVVHTIALDALGHVQDTVLDATIDAQHHVRHHALAVLDAVHAEVHADLNVHLHAWEDAQNRAQIAVLRFAEDAVLHARQIVLLIAEIHAKIHAMGKFHLQ